MSELVGVFLAYFNISDPVIQYVALNIMLLTASTALVGTFALLQKNALAGDAVSHAVLPGICIAFLVTGTKGQIPILTGAILTGSLARWIIDYIPLYSKLKEDTAIALVLSLFFGIGIFLLTIVQHKENAQQAGLQSFLYGKAASLTKGDIKVLTILALSITTVILAFYKHLIILVFDPLYARTIGMPVKVLRFLLQLLTVFAIVIGVQTVGIVLMSAVLITPPAAARFWSKKLSIIICISVIIACISSFIGTLISASSVAMPTGPWIVMIMSIFTIFSFLFAPKSGIVARIWRKKLYQKKIMRENVLKLFYQIGKKEENFFMPHGLADLLMYRPMCLSTLKKVLKSLTQSKLLQRSDNTWTLTAEGKKEGKRVFKLHLLWEAYLKKYLHLQPDHVHEDAEAMEHILTPELEVALQKSLDKPFIDDKDMEGDEPK